MKNLGAAAAARRRVAGKNPIKKPDKPGDDNGPSKGRNGSRQLEETNPSEK